MPIAIVSTLPKTPTAATVDSSNASSNDNAAGSPDFASLLLGQVASIPTGVIDAEAMEAASTTTYAAETGKNPLLDQLIQASKQASNIEAAVPEPTTTDSTETSKNSPLDQLTQTLNTETKEDTPTDVSSTRESQGDTAALLASLGLLPTERELKPAPAANTASDLSGATGAIDQSSTTTLFSRLQNATSGKQSALQESTAATDTSSPAGNTAPITDANAAKFAVTANIENNQEYTATADALASADNVGTDASASSASATTSHHLPTSHTTASKSALSIETPVSHTNWSNDFGQKIVWMANNDKQSAQLTLTPPQMGTIEISVSIDNNNATASFTSSNPEVREAIETALPRLREMFANAGIDLGQTNVSAESFRQQQENAKSGQAASQWADDEAILATELSSLISSQTIRTQSGIGLVDLFA